MYISFTVPSAPHGLELSVKSDISPVGVLVTWDTVQSAANYSITVMTQRLGDVMSFSSVVPSYIITSEAVGGYERVSVEVVAVNDAGYGPASEEAEGRTPPISMLYV